MGLDLDWKWMGIAVVFVVILAGIGVVITQPDSPQTAVSTPPKEIIVTKSPEQLLPVRSDIGTIWKIKNQEKKSIDSLGFIEGITQRFTKSDSSIIISITTVNVGVYKFDTPANSFQYYTKKINSLIDEGGYEQVHAKANDATCYGLEKSTQAGFTVYEVTEFRCVKGNIYVVVSSSKDNIWEEAPNSEFMRMVLDKIS